MEEGDIQLVTKIHNQTVELNTVWDQLFKAYDINNELIKFIQRNGLINQLKHEMLIKIGDAITNDNKENYSLYTHVYEKIKKIN